jgi:hypothetical protein
MLKTLFAIIFLTILLNCGNKDEPGLYYVGKNPLIIQLGDTTEPLVFKRVYTADLRGKVVIQESWKYITLESDDSSKVDIYNKLQLIGLEETSIPIDIHADDDSGFFITNFKVKVEDSLSSTLFIPPEN